MEQATTGRRGTWSTGPSIATPYSRVSAIRSSTATPSRSLRIRPPELRALLSSLPASSSPCAVSLAEYEEYVVVCWGVAPAMTSGVKRQSFFLLHSLGGGTGSGLGTYVLSLLADHYPDVYRFTTSVFPSEDDDVSPPPLPCPPPPRRLIGIVLSLFLLLTRPCLAPGARACACSSFLWSSPCFYCCAMCMWVFVCVGER